MEVTKVHVRKCREGAIIPKRATPGSSGFDVHACFGKLLDESFADTIGLVGLEDVRTEGVVSVHRHHETQKGVFEQSVTRKNITTVIPTGLQFQIPYGFEIVVRPRSGLAAKHGITVANSPGTIDSDYVGELCVILSGPGYTVLPDARIAQIVVQRIPDVELVEVEEPFEPTSRGSGGFGSTGVK